MIYIEKLELWEIILFSIVFCLGLWFQFIGPIIFRVFYKPVGQMTPWGTYRNYILRNKKLRDKANQKKQEKRKEEWDGYLNTINKLSNKYRGYNIDKKNFSDNRYLLKLAWEETDKKINKLIKAFIQQELQYDKKKTPEENEKFLLENTSQ